MLLHMMAYPVLTAAPDQVLLFRLGGGWASVQGWTCKPGAQTLRVYLRCRRDVHLQIIYFGREVGNNCQLSSTSVVLCRAASCWP